MRERERERELTILTATISKESTRVAAEKEFKLKEIYQNSGNKTFELKQKEKYIITNSPRKISPKDPLPILRPSLYLPPTIRSMLNDSDLPLSFCRS